MNRDFVEAALTERAAAANGLTVGDEQVRQLVRDARRSDAPRPRRVRRGRMSFATGFACLLLGGVIASAATGTIGSALDPFLGGGDAPGAKLPQGELPSWLDPARTGVSVNDASVIASVGDVQLLAYRQGDDVCFQYGGSVGECAAPSYYAEQLSRSPWILRGPTSPGDRRILFGFVDSTVSSVRVEYAVGPAVVARTENGGFAVELDESRRPQRVIGLDAAGEQVVSGPPHGG